MNRLIRLLLPATLALSGCASLPGPAPTSDEGVYRQHMQQLAAIDAFSLNGRMAVQAEYKGFSGTIRWRHSETGDRFAFFSPLGTQVAEIVSEPGNVMLTTSDRKTYVAEDAETLLLQTMGWSLPLQGLSDWVLGRPAPRPYEDIRWDAQGRITHLSQDGWGIDYPTYQDMPGTDLPKKIVLKSLRLDLKLLVEQWHTGREM